MYKVDITQRRGQWNLQKKWGFGRQWLYIRTTFTKATESTNIQTTAAMSYALK